MVLSFIGPGASGVLKFVEQFIFIKSGPLITQSDIYIKDRDTC